MPLDEIHQKAVIEILQRHRTKKSCNKCYDRGYIGFSPDKTVVPCEKCVNIETAMAEWKEYVSKDEKLKEEFADLFVEDKPAGDDGEHTDADGNRPETDHHTHEVKPAPKPERASHIDKKKPQVKQSSVHRKGGRRGA